MENRGAYFENNFRDDYHLNLLSLSDGELRTEDGCAFRIHRYALAKSSKYFYALFCGMEKARKDVLIPGVKGEILSDILAYLYTGDIRVKGENICDVMVAADYLMLDDMLSQLKPCLKRNLTVFNCLSMLLAALKIYRDDILKNVFRFVQTHFESIVLSVDPKIFELPLDVLKLLLNDKNLCVRSERTVWRAILNWVETDTASRIHFVPELLLTLAIHDVDTDLANEILQHDKVAKNPHCQVLLNLISSNRDDILETLRYYYDLESSFGRSVLHHRQPASLHCIVHYTVCNLKDGIQVYLTYDENIDLWRKMFEIDKSPEILLLVKDCIYMFQTSENRNYCYNVIENRWSELPNFRVERYDYSVVELNGVLYVLGGVSETTEEEIYDVEYYNSESGEWHITATLIPVSYFRAVAFHYFIYVTGYRLSVLGDEMVAQFYDSSNETWSSLPLDPIIRKDFAMVVYRDVIYVIGGSDIGGHSLKAVQVFNPVKNEWKAEADLPYAYILPKAIVLNDKLVVYDDHLMDRSYLKTNPSVQWNSSRKYWEPVEDSSFMNHLFRYSFLTVENFDMINVITNENRNPATHFESSHFA